MQLYFSRLKTVFLKVFAAKNGIPCGLPLCLNTLHLFRPFLSDVRIPREPKKTNMVTMCVLTRSSHTMSRHHAWAIVLSMMMYAKPHPQMDLNFYAKKKWKMGKFKWGFEETRVKEELKFLVCLVWPKLLFSKMPFFMSPPFKCRGCRLPAWQSLYIYYSVERVLSYLTSQARSTMFCSLGWLATTSFNQFCQMIICLVWHMKHLTFNSTLYTLTSGWFHCLCSQVKEL